MTKNQTFKPKEKKMIFKMNYTIQQNNEAKNRFSKFIYSDFNIKKREEKRNEKKEKMQPRIISILPKLINLYFIQCSHVSRMLFE